MAITITIDDIKRRLQLPAGSVNCVFVNTGDLITSVLHGLAVGDVVAFGTTTLGVTAGTLYWVRTIISPDVFEISATRGGALFALTGDGANTYFQKTVYDADITGIIAEMLPGLSGTIVAAHLATYEAACKQGIIDVIAGECLNMLRRQPGFAEQAKFGGNEVGEGVESGDKLIARGMAILEPFTVAGDAALDKVIAETAKLTAETTTEGAVNTRTAAETTRIGAEKLAIDAGKLKTDAEAALLITDELLVDKKIVTETAQALKVTAEVAKITADELLVDATELRTDAETAKLTAEELLTDAKTLTEAEMAAKVIADAAMSTGLAADANARAAAATARTARMAAEDAAIADVTDLPQESHAGPDDSPFAFDSEEYST